jgi:hypothetical protein
MPLGSPRDTALELMGRLIARNRRLPVIRRKQDRVIVPGISAFNNGNLPTNLPPGFSPYETKPEEWDVYMQDKNGNLQLTPDYSKAVHSSKFYLEGFLADLAAIGFGAVGGAGDRAASEA